MNIYDVVVTGSGLGGLLTAALLSKEGYNVCVIEKNPVFGGGLQTFKRKGVEFDTGMHYFGSFDKGQFLYRLFKYLDIYDKLKLQRLDIDGFDVINYNNKEYRFAQGFENFVEKLSVNFPAQRETIKTFVKKIKEIGRSEDLFNLVSGVNFSNLKISRYYSENAYRFVSSITNNKTLQNVLSGLNMLTGGEKDKTNLYIFGLIYYSYLESAWRFKGGSNQLTEALILKITEAGGTVIKNLKVTGFNTDKNRRISSVDTNQGISVFGNTFISNIHPVETIKLLPENTLRKVYTKRINRIENSLSLFTLFIVLQDNKFPYLNYNYYDYLTDSTWINKKNIDEGFPQQYWLSTLVPEDENEYARGIIAMSPIKAGLFEQWNNTIINKRGKAYLELKEMLADKLINSISQRFPGIKDSVKSYYTASPLTFRDYLGSPGGSAYGLIKDSENPFNTLLFPTTRIPNLFFTGQNINAHGMLGVSTGALLTVSYIVDLQNIVNKINKCQ